MDNNKSEGNLSPEAAAEIAKNIAAPFIGAPKAADDIFAQQLLDKKNAIRKAVVEKMRLIHPLLYSDAKAFGLACGREYLEHFHTWSKEELLFLLVDHYAKATVEHMQ